MKELWARDREQQNILKKTLIDASEARKEARADAAKVEVIVEQMRQLEEVCREKDGINAIIKNEMVAQKRISEKLESRVVEAERPLPGLREAANKQMHRAGKHKAAAAEWKLKATSL